MKVYQCHGVHFIMKDHEFIDINGVYLWYSREKLLADLQAINKDFKIDWYDNYRGYVYMAQHIPKGSFIKYHDRVYEITDVPWKSGHYKSDQYELRDLRRYVDDQNTHTSKVDERYLQGDSYEILLSPQSIMENWVSGQDPNADEMKIINDYFVFGQFKRGLWISFTYGNEIYQSYPKNIPTYRELQNSYDYVDKSFKHSFDRVKGGIKLSIEFKIKCGFSVQIFETYTKNHTNTECTILLDQTDSNLKWFCVPFSRNGILMETATIDSDGIVAQIIKAYELCKDKIDLMNKHSGRPWQALTTITFNVEKEPHAKVQQATLGQWKNFFTYYFKKYYPKESKGFDIRVLKSRFGNNTELLVKPTTPDAKRVFDKVFTKTEYHPDIKMDENDMRSIYIVSPFGRTPTFIKNAEDIERITNEYRQFLAKDFKIGDMR